MNKNIRKTIISDDDYMKYKKDVEEMERLILAAKQSCEKIEQRQRIIIHSNSKAKKVSISRTNNRNGTRLKIVIG